MTTNIKNENSKESDNEDFDIDKAKRDYSDINCKDHYRFFLDLFGSDALFNFFELLYCSRVLILYSYFLYYS